MTGYKHIEWFDSNEMHEHSKAWFSELSFIKDEQQFLGNLIKSFAIKPLDSEGFMQLKDFKNAITKNRHRLIAVFKQVQKHMNQLEIMIDDVNQLEMESAYRKTHKKLFIKVNEYLLDYRNIKQRGFSKLTHLLRDNKKIALGNPEYKIRTSKT